MRWYKHPAVIAAYVTGAFSLLGTAVVVIHQIESQSPSDSGAREELAPVREATEPGSDSPPVTPQRNDVEPPFVASGTPLGTEKHKTSDQQLARALVGRWVASTTDRYGRPVEIEVLYEGGGEFVQSTRFGLSQRTTSVDITGQWRVSLGRLICTITSSTDQRFFAIGHQPPERLIEVADQYHILANPSTAKSDTYSRIQ